MFQKNLLIDMKTTNLYQIRIASFNLPLTNYLLVGSDNAEISFLEPYRTKNYSFVMYRNNQIQEETDYYWIEIYSIFPIQQLIQPASLFVAFVPHL